MSRMRYEPMLAQTAPAPFSRPGWIFEIKWDGIRAIASVDSEIRVVSRTGRDLLSRFPELAELRELAPGTVIDGEIVVMRDGIPDFSAMSSRMQDTTAEEATAHVRAFPATYVVFDILEFRGNPVINRPLQDRLAILEKAVAEGRYVVRSHPVLEKGERYFDAVVQKGLEGVMAKDLQSTYRPGHRSEHWLKFIRTPSCDCSVSGYTKGKGEREATFGSLLLSLYDGTRSVFAGRVGTGFSAAARADLMHRFEPLQAESPTLEGVDRSSGVRWLHPGVVVAVRYKTVTRNGRLRMPCFAGIRYDIPPEACTIDQILPESVVYREKRDFSRTPEPVGEAVRESHPLIFVVQEHTSRHRHFDLRLARHGVLKSWAVPKGMPDQPGDRRLAIATEDHPIGYADFEGTIPDGEYGAGTVTVWDRGVYETLVWEDEKIEVVLAGEKLQGRYALVRFPKGGETAWLIVRARD
jgi:bifunctional non-homologous end joining protein LigD